MELNVSLKGVKEIAEKFKHAPEIIEEANREIMDMATLMVQGKAKELAPVKTTWLRKNILRDFTGLVGRVGTNVFYAPFQEFGTKRGIRPKRFFRGGLEYLSQNMETLRKAALDRLRTSL